MSLTNDGKSISQLSKSYYMNKNYLFTDSLNSPQGSIFNKNRNDVPEIQPLIINEFQPNVFLSIADILPGFVNKLGGALATIAEDTIGPIVKIGSKYITEHFMKEAADDPDSLYGKTHKYKRFTSDPVQTVRNMFMGGKWLNTFEIPYYGNLYLQADYKKNWEIGGVDGAGALGSGVGGLVKKFGIDYPGNPRFSVEMKESRK